MSKHIEASRDKLSGGQKCEPSHAREGSCSTLHVLVADDEPLLRKMMRLFFQQYGHLATVVASGQEAIVAWQEDDFDVILMDVQMPGMNGLETVRQIRTLEQQRGCRRVPILALTAHARSEDLENCLKAGMDDCISKPITIDNLFAQIGKYTDS